MVRELTSRDFFSYRLSSDPSRPSIRVGSSTFLRSATRSDVLGESALTSASMRGAIGGCEVDISACAGEVTAGDDIAGEVKRWWVVDRRARDRAGNL